ncbi:MAG: putative toxin-antitoxin system toxin component, PIN family [Pseudomonadota bacterium]|nr:putative toxin-antitoxin system toxin component, PIN family [Pseudomonadota bacterium]
MKVVLDTNVLISGIYFAGLPEKILEAWGTRRFQLLVSTEILQEYLNVAERLAARYAGVEYESVLGLIIQNAELAQTSDLPEPVSTDPDDDKFIACALAGNSTTIVSGDSDLLNVSGYCRIKVLTPKAFVSECLDQSG